MICSHKARVHDDIRLNSVNNNLYDADFSALYPIRCKYYSPYSFSQLKNELNERRSHSHLSFSHNNVSSLKGNLENFQTHLLDELNFHFSVIGVTETRIRNANFTPLNTSRHLFQRVVSACILIQS